MVPRISLAFWLLLLSLHAVADERWLDGPINSPSAAANPSYIAAADMDGDGIDDLVVTNMDTSSTAPAILSVHIGDGKGQFQAKGTYIPPSGGGPLTLGDVNNDGFVDVVVIKPWLPTGMDVYLGNGDGTLRWSQSFFNVGNTVALEDIDGDGLLDLVNAPNVFYNLGGGNFAEQGSAVLHIPGLKTIRFADVNGDGLIDAIIPHGSDGLYVETRSADGIFHVTGPFPSNGILDCVVGDFDEDGFQDVIGTNPSLNDLWFLRGNGNGIFQAPVSIFENSLLSGIVALDFDHDSHLDIAVIDSYRNYVDVLYNDGKGNFTLEQNLKGMDNPGYLTPIAIAGGPRDSIATTNVTNNRLVAYIPKFGTRTSLVAPASTSPSQPITLKASVTLAPANVGLGTIPSGSVAFKEGTSVLGSAAVGPDGTSALAITLLAGTHSLVASYSGDETFFRSTSYHVIVTSTDPVGCSTTTVGVRICSPASGSSESSPLKLQAAAYSQAGVGWMEAWIDGAKKYSGAGSKIDTSLTVAPGTHQLTVYGIESSTVKYKASSNFSVAASGSCVPPSTATAIVICAPISGAHSTSPLKIQAVGGSSISWMEIWMDGAKLYQTSGRSIDTSVTLAAGQHAMTAYGKSSGATVDKKTTSFTVDGAVGCLAPNSSGGVVICSPIAGTSVVNPVQISALGGASVTWMEAWIDGAKVNQGSGARLNYSATLTPGSHSLKVYAKVGSTVTASQTAAFTSR